MKTAGLVLDFYDDRSGELLKSVYPDAEALPEIVKTAHILTSEERGVLRDEAYALILHSDDGALRKFACVDEGNTHLSTLYFLENAGKLPAEAIKVAAQNLIAFNQEFSLPVPFELLLAAETGLPVAEKTASLMPMGKEPASKDYVKREQTKGGRIINRLQDMTKVSADPLAKKRDTKNQPYVGDEADWAQRTNLISVRGGADSGRVIPTANQMKTANVVDVSALEPRPQVKQKTASRTALDGRYSLDSYLDVKQAVSYFADNWTSMKPEDRHEYGVKVASRADELGIELPEVLERYGSTEYAPDVEAHLANRRAVDPAHAEIWNDLQEKRAMVEPEQFAQLLREADELFNLDMHWGGAVADPYYATFGGRGAEQEKTASADGVTEEQLRSIPMEFVHKNFTSDFAEAFAAQPLTIYESMPMDTKQILARAARGE